MKRSYIHLFLFFLLFLSCRDVNNCVEKAKLEKITDKEVIHDTIIIHDTIFVAMEAKELIPRTNENKKDISYSEAMRKLDSSIRAKDPLYGKGVFK